MWNEEPFKEGEVDLVLLQVTIPDNAPVWLDPMGPGGREDSRHEVWRRPLATRGDYEVKPFFVERGVIPSHAIKVTERKRLKHNPLIEHGTNFWSRFFKAENTEYLDNVESPVVDYGKPRLDGPYG
jgi:hypothetical protein